LDKYSVVFNRFQSYTTINTVRSYCACSSNNGLCVCGASNNGIVSAFDAWMAKFFDEYLIWHHSGTANLCSYIAVELGMCSTDRRMLIQSALLHDIGKLFVSYRILSKMGVLSDEEMAILKNHSLSGADFLLRRGFSEDIVLSIKHHHERHDGTGYPDGLSGFDIPLNSRIISVADTLDAMLSGRHYHESKYDRTEIATALEDGKGKHFDPQIAEIALRYILKKENVVCLK